MKKLYGQETYVQSAGLKNDLEIDGFAIAVCAEEDMQLERHQSRSFEELEQLGDQLSSFDLIVALTPASHARAQELTKLFHLDVVFWDIVDPTPTGETRAQKLAAYRQTRDQLYDHISAFWGAT